MRRSHSTLNSSNDDYGSLGKSSINLGYNCGYLVCFHLGSKGIGLVVDVVVSRAMYRKIPRGKNLMKLGLAGRGEGIGKDLG